MVAQGVVGRMDNMGIRRVDMISFSYYDPDINSAIQGHRIELDADKDVVTTIEVPTLDDAITLYRILTKCE